MLTTWLQFTSHPSTESLLRFGRFTACMNFHRDLNSSQAVQGQYCMISYTSILTHDFDETSIEYGKYVSDSIYERDTMIFKSGICVPASCSFEQIVQFVKEFLRETNLIVLSVFCQTRENLTLRLLDYLLLWGLLISYHHHDKNFNYAFFRFLLAIIFILIGLSTFYDLQLKGRNFKLITWYNLF